jgi:hypothetical protein
MLQSVLKPWRAIQRAQHVKHLWPDCKREAQRRVDEGVIRKEMLLDRARETFRLYAFNDPAWKELGTDEIIRRINELE